MQKIVNSRTNIRMTVALALSFAGVLACSSLVFGETQNADGNSENCNGSSIDYAPNSANVCQSDTSTSYRFSRWVYYTINADNLPTENGKKYIPPIGIANKGNGIADGGVEGWLVVEPAMSDCIVENGGFWRRGYFQKKNDIYQERSYKGLTFGVTQKGVAPVGFTGRSSNNISSANQVGHNDSSHTVGEWYPTFSLGEQTMYVGDRTKVWAKMDTSAGMIDDAEAQNRLNEFANSGNPETLDYGDYFLSDYDKKNYGDDDSSNATVLFCYSDISPFDGVVKIGSDGSNYAFNSKNHGESKEQGTYKDGSKVNNDNTIDLGVVNEYDYTPGYLLMQVSKANDKTGKTKYSATMTLNGATKYAFDGSNWTSKDQAIENTTSSTVTSSTSPSFVLEKGDNTICIALDYKEKQNDGSSQNLKACAKVKYVPLIANEIDSKTSAAVSEGSKTGVSDPDNGDAGNPGIDANVPYGKDVTVSWKHSLGIKRVEKDDDKHVALDPLMGKFIVKYAKLGESWSTSGLSKELSSGTYNSGLDDFNIDDLYETDNVKLLPGDRKELLRGITHPQTVKNDSTATSTGSESSSLKVTLTADTVKCAINGKDIGVNNPDNYAKMSMSISESYKSRTVGDGVDDSGNPYPSSSTVWLKGNDKIKKFSYSVCDGAQIAKDRAWLDSNPSVTDWTSASVTNLDKFEISMNPLNNSLNGRLYNTNSNGRTPATSIQLFGVEGKNIRADEIGDNKYLQARVDAGYQLEDQDTVAATEASYQLGQTIEHSISFQTSNNDATVKKYSITTKVPYNYIIDPGFDQFDGSSIYYGEDISAVSNVKVKGRVNEDTGATATDIPTLTKTSKYYTAIFTLDAGKNHDDLLNGISASGATRMKDSFGNETRDFYIQSDDEFENIVNNQIGGTVVARTTEKDGTATTKIGEGVAVSVGTKYCAVAAVWPADSHNDMNVTGDSVIASGNPQTNALIGDNPGTGAYWRFEISCRTLGKKPTVSVEGSGIVSGGGVITSTTNYGGNIFGSWSEYGLIADNSTSVNFGTGASLAYHGPQYSVNEQAIPSEAGLDKNAKCIGIETVGNIKCLEQVGLDTSEVNQYVSNANNIKSRIIGKNNISKHNGSYVINSNVSKNADGSTPIIYADNIKIHPDVTEINAILIADGNLDTCYLEDKQNETTQGGTKGNYGLKDLCGKQLVVNGAVFADSIALDRTFGGGSYGDNLWVPSLVQRAEIFNFDPSYVSEAYEQSLEEDPITTTYIKELPSRY